MSDTNEDRTLAFQDHTALDDSKTKLTAAGIIEVPKARLICTDTSLIEGKLPGEGIIHLIPGSEQNVGRGDTCTYPIPSRKLSRRHARIFGGVGVWGVEDLDSTNGIQVNRQKVATAWLKHGDEVRFGPIPFRFELERPDLAHPAAASTPAAAPPDDMDSERTMMVGSLGASRAVIEAVRKVEEPVPEVVVPRRPATPGAGVGRAPGRAAPASRRWLLLALGAAAVVGLGVAGALYYPTFHRQQQIADVVSRGTAVLNRVVARSRDLAGTTPGDSAYRDDIAALEPVIGETWTSLATYPTDLGLINLYARARFLSFERIFTSLIGKGSLADAERLSNEVKSRLDELDHRLPATLVPADKTDLATAAGLTDLATAIVALRRFGQAYAKVAPAPPNLPAEVPTPAQLQQVEARRDTFNRLRKVHNQALSRDYLLFNGLIKDIDNKDINLVGRWRDLLR